MDKEYTYDLKWLEDGREAYGSEYKKLTIAKAIEIILDSDILAKEYTEEKLLKKITEWEQYSRSIFIGAWDMNHTGFNIDRREIK